jgi:hypothetical protein
MTAFTLFIGSLCIHPLFFLSIYYLVALIPWEGGAEWPPGDCVGMEGPQCVSQSGQCILMNWSEAVTSPKWSHAS